MKIRISFFVLAILAGLLFTLTAMARDPADIILSAETAGHPIPLLSALFPDLDGAGAMEIQKAYVQQRLDGERPAGFKAGLTSKKGQERFGLSGPVAGVLFRRGKHDNQAAIDAAAFHLPMIETEIGFVLGRALSQEIKTPEAVRAAVRDVMPVIELPDLGFADMKALKGVDIIAANVSSRQFVLGDPRPAGATDLNAVAVTLYRNGAKVNTGTGRDALGDQWKALAWLINTMIGQGYSLEPGQVLITGAMGKMIPGKRGEYRADYGDFGTITFEIR